MGAEIQISDQQAASHLATEPQMTATPHDATDRREEVDPRARADRVNPEGTHGTIALMRRLIRKEAADRGIESPSVIRDPERCAGDPILAGTRTAVHDVVAYARIYNGDLGEVHAEIPHLSMEQIRTALAWYGEHTAEIDEILRQVREDYA